MSLRSLVHKTEYIVLKKDSNLEKIKQFQADGFLILEDFLTEEEVTNLKKAGIELAENVPADTQKTVFSTTQSPQVSLNLNYF